MIEEAIMSLPDDILKLALATALGLFIGLEREMSDKMAGVRTFTLIGLVGGSLSLFDDVLLLLLGGLLVIVFSVLMAMKDIVSDEDIGLSLTTSAALLTTYVVGGLAGQGELFEAVFIGVLAAVLLMSKQELHKFAVGITKDEMRSAVEFAVIAFIVFPLLPSDPIGPWEAVDAQLVWLLVVAVSGLGFVNYILVRRYQEKGFVATGFFGGLVNSTAVIGSIADRVAQDNAPIKLAVGAVLLANAAMALRNAVIAGVFLPETIVYIGAPLIALSITGVLISIFVSDWDDEFTAEFSSPFSLKNALTFGAFFLGVVLISAGLTEFLGDAGFFVSVFLAGLVSSGSATTTAVTLASTGQISMMTAAYGVLLGTAASITAKVFLAATIERSLVKPTIIWSIVLMIVGIIVTTILTIIII